MTDQLPLNSQTLGTFLNTLASRAPTPGGGSVAAISGATAAGLVSMVCALSIGKKRFAEIEDELRGIHDRAESLRRELQELAEADIEVFSRLSTAYKLPRTTDADAASRNAAIQSITRQAADIPLQVARAAVAIIPLCEALAERAGRLIVSDIGVAAALARATLQSAILNIEINLSGLEDQIYVRTVRSEVAELSAGVNQAVDAIMTTVSERINRD
jgi:formiminotetrahydrofolate cyclodeaminase